MQRKRFVTVEEIEEFGFDRASSSLTAFYLNNDFFAKLAVFSLGIEVCQVDESDVLTDGTKKSVAFLFQQAFFQSLLEAKDKLLFLQEREFIPSLCIKNYYIGNLHSWVNEIRHHYASVSMIVGKESPTWNVISKEYGECLSRLKREYETGKPNPEWIRNGEIWYVSVKFKDSGGGFPVEIQERIIEEAKPHIEGEVVSKYAKLKNRDRV